MNSQSPGLVIVQLLIPSLQLGTGKTAAVRLAGKSCLSRVSLSVRAEGRQARVCVIQRRFAIRVDSVPSRKLGPARTRPRVLPARRYFLMLVARNTQPNGRLVVRLCVCLSVGGRCPRMTLLAACKMALGVAVVYPPKHKHASLWPVVCRRKTYH